MSGHEPHHVYVAQGNAYLRRLDALTSPGAVLKTWTSNFRKVHKALVADDTAVTTAFNQRHDALAAAVTQEASLEEALPAVLDVLPGLGIGTRQNPLRDLSSYTPHELHALGHQHLANEVASIIKKARKKAPKDKVFGAALDTLAARVTALSAAVAAIAPLEDGYHATVRTRDGALVGWTSTLGKLKRRVATHFEDTPDEAAAIFAPPAPTEADVPLVGAPGKRASKGSKAANATAEKAAKVAGRQASKAVRAAAKASAASTKSAKKVAKQTAKATAKTAAEAAKAAKKAAGETKKKR